MRCARGTYTVDTGMIIYPAPQHIEATLLVYAQ